MLDWVGLLTVAACLLNSSAGHHPLTVNVTEKTYQREEQENITLTFHFFSDSDGPPPPLDINLMRSAPMQSIYRYYSGSEAEPYVHPHYRGRLRCSQVASRSQVECSITHLRRNDSSEYVCLIVAGNKSNISRCDVMVTAVQVQPEEEEPEPASRERFWLFASIGLFTVAVAALIIRDFTLNTCC